MTPEPMHKTTKADFARFKKACILWQKKLGLHRYKLAFSHEYLDDCYAGITVNIQGGIATMFLTTEFPVQNMNGWGGPEPHAKHEMLELLLKELEDLAEQRYIRHEEIEAARHRIIRTLEKVL